MLTHAAARALTEWNESNTWITANETEYKMRTALNLDGKLKLVWTHGDSAIGKDSHKNLQGNFTGIQTNIVAFGHNPTQMKLANGNG